MARDAQSHGPGAVPPVNTAPGRSKFLGFLALQPILGGGKRALQWACSVGTRAALPPSDQSLEHTSTPDTAPSQA